MSDNTSEQPDAKEENRVPKEKYRDRLSDALAALEKTIADKADAERTQERTEDRGNKRISVATLLFVILTTIGILIQDFILHSSDEAAHISASAALNAAEATKRAADTATKQSEIATRQAEASERAMNQAQRAWVGPRNASSQNTPEIGKDLSVGIDYQNTGREPALETIFGTDVFTATSREESAGVTTNKINSFLRECKNSWKPGNATVVFPSAGGNGSSYELSRTVAGDIIDQEVMDGAKAIFVTGCFVYKTSGSIHRTTFCYYFKSKKTKPANWNICQAGNDAD